MEPLKARFEFRSQGSGLFVGDLGVSLRRIEGLSSSFVVYTQIDFLWTCRVFTARYQQKQHCSVMRPLRLLQDFSMQIESLCAWWVSTSFKKFTCFPLDLLLHAVATSLQTAKPKSRARVHTLVPQQKL